MIDLCDMKIKACRECNYFYERSCKKTIERKWYDPIEGIEHIDYVVCVFARKDYDIAGKMLYWLRIINPPCGSKGRYWTPIISPPQIIS